MAAWFSSFILAFFISLLLGFLLVPLLARLKAGQPVLKYVKEHEGKRGTPTMGGLIFLLGISAAYFSVNGLENGPALIAVVIMLAYGLVGAMDDLIKIRSQNNLGLKAYQKIIFQLAIALIAGIYAGGRSGEVYLPFWGKMQSLGGFAVPLYVFIFLAMTNGVNLTDGLDGLASKAGALHLGLFCVPLGISLAAAHGMGDTYAYADYGALLSLCLAGAGSLLAYLYFNTFPAKVIMGDTGSLGLGGLIASAAVFTEYALFLPLFGIMFVVSCVSVVLQVAYFKLTKGKRIFLIAPYHHHLQRKGMHENRITAVYALITVLVGAVTLYFSFFR